MFFFILFVVTFVTGAIFSVSLNMILSHLFKLPLYKKTNKLLPSASKSDVAFYFLFTNIGMLQMLLTPIPLLLLLFQPLGISFSEAIFYFIGSLLFGVMVFLVAFILAKLNKKIFSILIIDLNNL